MSHPVSLNQDLLDCATLAVPSTVALEDYIAIIHMVSDVVASKLPGCRVVPYGSFAAGLILKHWSDLDLTVVGEGDPSHVVLVVSSLLQAGGQFTVSIKPTIATAHPLIRFEHTATGVCGDITVNEVDAIRTAGCFSAYCHANPLSGLLAVIIKSIARGAGLPRSCVTSVVISVLAFGFVSYLRSQPSEEVRSLAHVFLEFIKFFGRDALLRDPQSILISVGGIAHVCPGSRFLTWNVLDPVTGFNVAERCTLIREFAVLMEHVERAVTAHYDVSKMCRASGSQHILQLLPSLSHILPLGRPQPKERLQDKAPSVVATGESQQVRRLQRAPTEASVQPTNVSSLVKGRHRRAPLTALGQENRATAQ